MVVILVNMACQAYQNVAKKLIYLNLLAMLVLDFSIFSYLGKDDVFFEFFDMIMTKIRLYSFYFTLFSF